MIQTMFRLIYPPNPNYNPNKKKALLGKVIIIFALIGIAIALYLIYINTGQ